ncbi:MAG: hypothetical protein A2428_02405 [Bdellovibrionales bacterium RIFOXYC1_FULL_54_43]|nr:MAG: hypothetical protein A2428_02405 [Bdellovibrionales bacterium RIFOXYC1_FULL_54_43]
MKTEHLLKIHSDHAKINWPSTIHCRVLRRTNSARKFPLHFHYLTAKPGSRDEKYGLKQPQMGIFTIESPVFRPFFDRMGFAALIMTGAGVC